MCAPGEKVMPSPSAWSFGGRLEERVKRSEMPLKYYNRMPGATLCYLWSGWAQWLAKGTHCNTVARGKQGLIYDDTVVSAFDIIFGVLLASWFLQWVLAPAPEMSSFVALGRAWEQAGYGVLGSHPALKTRLIKVYLLIIMLITEGRCTLRGFLHSCRHH